MLMTNFKSLWLRHTSFYRSWAGMKSRCTNKNLPDFLNYGWRWIIYDNNWENFMWFYHDMFSSYEEWLSIDRIDVNGNYCKENCRWANRTQQNRNTKRNTIITNSKWISKTLAEWSEITWIKRTTISMRILQYWWSIDNALTIIPE